LESKIDSKEPEKRQKLILKTLSSHLKNNKKKKSQTNTAPIFIQLRREDLYSFQFNRTHSD